MQTRALIVLLSGAIGFSLVGCAGSSPVMRAQSPQASFASFSGGHGHGHGSHAGCPMCDSGFAATGQPMCGPNCGPQCDRGCNLPFHPVHRNFHTYSAPQGLMYPSNDTPAATYQYPYYTLRGPTDFFMK